MDASPEEGDVAGTVNSIFSKLENLDAARSGVDALLGEGDTLPGEGDVVGTGNSIFSKLKKTLMLPEVVWMHRWERKTLQGPKPKR